MTDVFDMPIDVGMDYFIINQYLKYKQPLSEYDLTRILNLIDKKNTSRKNITSRLESLLKNMIYN